MEGIQLGSEASYDWEPFVVQVLEKLKENKTKKITRKQNKNQKKP